MSYLSGRSQLVLLSGKCSESLQLNQEVPQGSCLGPLLFTLYASKLFEVVKRHLPSVHAYADDTQLYLAFKPGCASSTNDAIVAMERCVNEIRAWMLWDKLKINDGKTEFVAGLPRARSARGTEPHTHRLWSTSFPLVVT